LGQPYVYLIIKQQQRQRRRHRHRRRRHHPYNGIKFCPKTSITFVTGKYLTLLYLSYVLKKKEAKTTVGIIMSVCLPSRNNSSSNGRTSEIMLWRVLLKFVDQITLGLMSDKGHFT
jgi:hypothetical protein